MDIYTDYANWLMDNHDLIHLLKEKHSLAIRRFEHVFKLVDFLYNRKIDKNDLELFEEEFFEAGFNYLFEHIMFISLLYKNTFNKNIDELEEFGKEINLYLYALEFEKDLETHEMVDTTKLLELEEQILNKIESKSHIDDTLFVMLDEVVSTIYADNKIEFSGGLNEIFYSIALEYDLISEDYEELDLLDYVAKNDLSKQ